MLDNFYLYWTEKKELGRKMKFEMQQTWDTKLRLQRWFRNDYGNKPKTNKKEAKTGAESFIKKYKLND